jgi:hypothetical protein
VLKFIHRVKNKGFCNKHHYPSVPYLTSYIPWHSKSPFFSPSNLGRHVVHPISLEHKFFRGGQSIFSTGFCNKHHSQSVPYLTSYIPWHSRSPFFSPSNLGWHVVHPISVAQKRFLQMVNHFLGLVFKIIMKCFK